MVLSTKEQLRTQAETLAKREAVLENTSVEKLAHDDIIKLVHELQVHQIELQLQNEELQTTLEELESSKTKYFELYNLAPVGYVTLNEKGLITESNFPFCNLLGYTRQFILNQPLTKFIYSEDQDIFYHNKKRLQQSLDRGFCELRMVGIHDKVLHTRIESSWFQATEKNVSFCHCIISDISEKKQQEILFHKQFNLLQALINSPKDIIFSLDREYRYTAFNHNHYNEMQTIWDADIKIGDRIFDYMKIPTLIMQAKLSMDRALQGENIVEIVYQNDRDIYYEMDWNPIVDAESTVVGLTCFIKDVTARKASEEIIKNTNDFLEQKVRERTLDLEVSKYELEAFSQSVAHDLTSPLRSIDGFSNILLEDYSSVLDTEAKRLLEIIKKSAAKMDQIITSLLHLAHIAQSDVNLIPTDMKSLVMEVWEEIQTETNDTATLILDELPHAMCDQHLMKLVWHNLLANALKFSKDQQLREVRISGVIKDRCVEYAIADTGVGFDMNYYSQLFVAFHRLHNDQEFAGHGISLSIVQRIILKHCGKIWATSEVGHGAAFYFRLPAVL